jgi:hypothetical protein
VNKEFSNHITTYNLNKWMYKNNKKNVNICVTVTSATIHQKWYLSFCGKRLHEPYSLIQVQKLSGDLVLPTFPMYNIQDR